MIKNEQEQGQYPGGIKWTKQRKSVYDVLKTAKGPLNAHQIYQAIMQADGTTGEEYAGSYAVSTIYRILGAFEKQHLVTKSNWMNTGTLVYELERGEHIHYAVCLSCHKQIPLQMCPLEHMPQAEHAFKITGHKLEIYGYCRSCQEAETV